jgi:SAM-dependent methyltransferase
MQELGMNEKVFTRPETVRHYATFTALYDKEEKILDTYYRGGNGPSQALDILDLGCGAGRITRVLHELGHRVIGADISLPLIQEARRLYPSIPFELADAQALPYGDETFDHVWFSFNGLDFVYPTTARMRALREIWRVVRPGGRFIFSSHNSLCFLTTRPSRWADIGRNAVRGRLWQRYRKLRSAEEGEMNIFYQNPWGQMRTLRAVGFGACDMVSSQGSLVKQIFSDSWPYYVATKPA